MLEAQVSAVRRRDDPPIAAEDERDPGYAGDVGLQDRGVRAPADRPPHWRARVPERALKWKAAGEASASITVYTWPALIAVSRAAASRAASPVSGAARETRGANARNAVS